ncbi:MAG: repetative protein, partial [Chloroflexota bacterium]|nr:repetative protein [Chloroflexota bacterium]
MKDLTTGVSWERFYDGSVEGCSWSHDGLRLAVARDDGYVDLLASDLTLVVSVALATSAARSVAWSDDDQLLVAGAYDGGIHLISRNGVILKSLRDGRFWPRAVAVRGSLIAVGSFWSAAHILDLTTLAEVSSPSDPTDGPNAICSTGNGRILLGTDSGLVVDTSLYSDGSDANSVTFVVSQSPVLSVTASSDGSWASNYAGHVISVFNPMLGSE